MQKRYSNAHTRARKSISKTPLLVLFLLFAGIMLVAGNSIAPKALAATSNTMNFQARLLTSSGTVVPDGNYHIEFKIYDSISSGASAQGVCSLNSSTDDCWWMETRTTGNLVRVVNGYFSVNLGSVTAFGSSIPWDQQLYLTMNIGGTGGSPSWDGEMLSSGNRMSLTAVPYAFRANVLAASSGSITNLLQFATPSSSNKTLTLPDETGTICTTGSICTGYLGTSTGVQLQASTPGSQQTGNFNVSGTGIAGTALLSPSLDNTTGAILTIGTGTATGVTIGSTTETGGIIVGQSTATNSISIGSATPGASSTQTISIGNGSMSNASSAINVNILSGSAGSAGTATLLLGNNDRVTQIDVGNVAADAARTLNFGTGANSVGVDTLNIGIGSTSVAGGKTIHIGDTAPTGSGTNLITIGSTTNASTLTLQGGTGSGAISVQAGSGGTISVGTASNNVVTIGSTTTTSAITLGQSTDSSTISIGSNNSLASGKTQTINLGTSTGSGSTTTINIGSTVAGVTTLQSAGGVAVTTLGSANTATYLCRNSSNIIATCSATSTGTAFVQGGNSFGATAVLGTTDTQALQFITDSVGRGLFSATTNTLFLGNAGSTGVANTPNAFTVAGTGSATTGTAGGDVTIKGGAGNSASTGSAGGALILQGGSAGGSGNNNAGTVTIQGGTPTGSGTATINIAQNSAAQIVNVGNTTGASSLSLLVGTGNFSLDGVGGSTYAIGNSTVAGTIAIGGTAQTGALSIGQSTATNTVNIASADPGASATQTVNIGNGSLSGSATAINVNILSGTAGNIGTAQLKLGNNDRVTQVDVGNVVADAARTLNVFTGASVAVDTLNIGTGATSVANGKTINIGSTAPTGSGSNVLTIGTISGTNSTTTIQGGTGASAIGIQAGSGGTISVGTSANNSVAIGTATTTGTIQIGGSGTTAGITIGQGTTTNTITIGSAITGNSQVQTINVGTSTGSASSTTINIGSTQAGITTLQSAGGVAVTALGTADTATYLCRNTSNLLATCNTTGTGAAFKQGGNSFGALAQLGTTDSNSLQIITASSARALFDTSNNLYLGNADATGAATTPTSFAVLGTSSSVAGNTNGGSLSIKAGSAAGAGNNNGGNLTLDAGAKSNSGTNGVVNIGNTNASQINIGNNSILTAITGNATVSGTINTNTFTSTALTFSGASPVISAGTTNTGLTLQANGSGTLTLGNTTGGTVNLGTANTTTVGIGNTGAVLTLEGSSAAGGIVIGNSANNHGIQIGTGAAVQTIVIGSTNTTSSTAIVGGATGSVNIGSVGSSTAASTTNIANTSDATGTQTVNIGSVAKAANTTNITAGTTGGVNIGSVGSSTTGSTVHIGDTTNATSAQAITIGSTAANAGNITTIQGGTGTGAISVQAGSGGTIVVGTAANNAVTIGSTSTTSAIVLGQSTDTSTISIGSNNSLASGKTQTINLGTSTGTGSTTTINIGSTVAGVTTLQSAGGVAVTTLGSANTVTYLCRNGSNLISTCQTNATGSAFVQLGNTFGATGVLGTTDAFGLQFITQSVGRAIFDTSNNLFLGNANSSGVANSPNSFTVAGTGSNTTGTPGADVTFIGGAGNGSGTGSAAGTTYIKGANAGGSGNNNGGTVVIQAGTPTGSGTATINIAQNSAAQTVNIGNTTGATAINERVGTGNYTLDGVAASTFSFGASTVAGTLDIGGTAQTGQLTIGRSTDTNTIAIGSSVGNTKTQTINIGTSATAGSTSNLVLGSSIGGSTTINSSSTAINSSTITTTQSAVNLFGSNATTMNAFGAATTLTLGSTSSSATTTIRTGNTTLGNAAGSGTFTNNGATLNSTWAISNMASGGSIGTAASTVDIYTSISIAQTTAGQTITIPSPTASSSYGRLLYVSNIGTAAFVLSGVTLGPGQSGTLVWSNTNGGASWIYAGAGADAISNQNTFDQTANFRISGTGRANTSFTSPLFDSISGGLSLGTSTATSVSIGGTTNTTSVTLQGAAGATYNVGASAGSGVLTNNGATVNSTLALSNFASGGSIGSAATTVDIYTSISVNQTTSGQTLSIAAPTASTTYGRMLYLSNIGNVSYKIGTATINPGATASLIWSHTTGGDSWQFAGADAGNLQGAYTNSTGGTTPEIKVDSTRGGVDIQDADSSINATLFAVRNSNSSGLGASIFDVQSANPITDITNNANNNLVANGSFEADTTGWSKMGSTQVAVAQDTTQRYIGSGSLKVVTNATDASGTDGASYNLTTSTLASNTTYKMFVYARASAGTSFSTFEIGRAENGSTNTSCLTAQTVSGSGWTQFSCTFTTGTTSGTPYIYARQTDQVARTFYIDAVQLTRYSLLSNNYADQTFAAGDWVAKGAATVTRDTTQNQAGAGTASVKIATSTNASNNDGVKHNITLNDSTLYYLSFYAKLDSGSTALSTMEAGYSSDGSTDNTVCITGQSVVSTGWTNYTCAFTTPSSHSGTPFFYVNELNTTGVKTFYVDNVVLTIGNGPLGSYREGQISASGIISSPVTLQNQSDSNSALQVMNSQGDDLLTVDSVNGIIQVGSSSSNTKTTILVLNNNDGTNTPPEVDGGMYYNNSTGQFLCGAFGFWVSCGVPPRDHSFDMYDEFMSGNSGALATGAYGIGSLNWYNSLIGVPGSLTYTNNPAAGGNTPAADADRPGIMNIEQTGNGNNTGQTTSLGLASMKLGTSRVDYKTSVNITAPQSTVLIGLHNETTATTAPTTGVYWKEAGAGAWNYCYVNGSNTETCTSTGTNATAGTWYNLQIKIVSSSQVDFYLNSTKYSLTGITYNTTNKVAPAYTSYKTTGTPTTQDIYIDYFQLLGTTTTTR